MIDSLNFFDQPINNNSKTYENIRKIAIVPEDDYTRAYLLDFPYYIEWDRLVAIDLSKQQQVFYAERK